MCSPKTKQIVKSDLAIVNPQHHTVNTVEDWQCYNKLLLHSTDKTKIKLNYLETEDRMTEEYKSRAIKAMQRGCK